eukprot:720525-Alexandrium_andersonii.AAC.1
MHTPGSGFQTSACLLHSLWALRKHRLPCPVGLCRALLAPLGLNTCFWGGIQSAGFRWVSVGNSEDDRNTWAGC